MLATRMLAITVSLSLGLALAGRDAAAAGTGGSAGVGMGIGGYYPGICGATGTVTAYCPTYENPTHTHPERPAEPYRYRSPTEECEKSGWGITECPNYGKKEKE